MSTYTTFEEYKTARVEEVLKDAEAQWKSIETQQRLGGLFREFGFRSNVDLIAALQKLVDGNKTKKKAKSPAKGKAGKRVKITPEIAAKVKELKAQGLAASAISKTLGVSAPTIYKIVNAKGA